jgi:fluoride ion exporter CrcB/FEX
MLETQRIDAAGKRQIGIVNVVLSIGLGLGAAALGRVLGGQL